MSSYGLNFWKNTESKNPKVYQNVQCVIIKNQNLSDRKKQVDY